MNKKPVHLTEKQKQFYESLQRLIEKNGESPTVAELVRLMKFSSPRAVTQYLEALERKGLVERRRYERRGIRLVDWENGAGGTNALGSLGARRGNVATLNVPVIASAGCDHMAVFAQRNFGDYICIARELLQGVKQDNVVCVKAVGDSMVDAGIRTGDYVLVEVTEAVHEGDLVVAIVDGFAVIKKLEYATNAVILRPVSSDPQYKPIILRRDFNIFGKVIDVIRMKPKDDIEIVPLYSQPDPDGERMNYDFI
ncbi:MAG TPA: transcriptional repressor LexA [Candidatus Paceibacterota bacterium]|nr:transcriptional repressor LexA [Candidatus Paceibacterota bacterium]